MKYLLIIFLFACTPSRELLEVKTEVVTLKEVNRVTRWNADDKQEMIWENDRKQPVYVQFEDWGYPYFIGQKKEVFLTR